MTQTNAEQLADIQAAITTNGTGQNTGQRVREMLERWLAREGQANGSATLAADARLPANQAPDEFDAAFTSLALEGPVIDHDPAADPNEGGCKFRLSYINSDWTNGPVGEENYIDDVWGLGINYTSGGGAQIDATKAAVGLTFESKFAVGGTFMSEVQFRHIDESGVARRFLSGIFPHDGGTGSSQTWRSDSISFSNWADTQQISMNMLTPTITLFNSLSIRFNVNNVATLYQINAAGDTVLKLPFINSSNKLAIEQPVTISAAGSATFMLLSPSTASTNDKGINIPVPTFTGDYFSYDTSGNVTGFLSSQIFNTNNTSGGAHARLRILTGGASGGDPIVVYSVSGATSWSHGIDNSASDAFKISASSALGTSDRITIDANTVAFGLPAKLPSYAVGSLPVASTVGAGARAFATDANATLAAGIGTTVAAGGANFVPVFSDGTNWIIG